MRIDEAERGETMNASGQGAIVEESGQAQACVSLVKGLRYRGFSCFPLTVPIVSICPWFHFCEGEIISSQNEIENDRHSKRRLSGN
jgi:hypothetical protein